MFSRRRHYGRRQIIQMSLVSESEYTDKVLLRVPRFAWRVARAFLSRQAQEESCYAVDYNVGGYTVPDVATMDKIKASIDDFLAQEPEMIAIVGEIRMFASTGPGDGNWKLCDGQLYSPAGEPVLFDAIGYTHGRVGDDFRVPDLEARFARGTIYPDQLGETGGSATHTLQTSEMPGHTHPFNVLQIAAAGSNRFTSVGTVGTKISTDAAGGGQPHNNLPPYIKLGFWIFAG